MCVRKLAGASVFVKVCVRMCGWVRMSIYVCVCLYTTPSISSICVHMSRNKKDPIKAASGHYKCLTNQVVLSPVQSRLCCVLIGWLGCIRYGSSRRSSSSSAIKLSSLTSSTLSPRYPFTGLPQPEPHLEEILAKH